MRRWLFALAALALCALGERGASAQTLDCSVVPQSICESEDTLLLEGERSALIQQIADLDPQHAALAGEQAWIDGLGACGEDAECYRSAYLTHNQTLRESVDALAGAETAPLEEPPDAAAIGPPTEGEDAAPARRAERARDGPVYAPSGLPGWGFFTAIGVTLLIFYALLRALAKHRRELRAEEARLRDEWR
ncbi:MAG: hypothetical protein ACT4OF_11450 [Caulobacteraceae bacterium]